MGRRLGHHVYSTGVLPATTYGASIAYPPASAITQMRTTASRLLGTTKGSSVTARLAINRCDPEKELVAKAINTWSAYIGMALGTLPS